MTTPSDAEREARRLREAWERRAQSPARDFFVASHPGWDDAEAWAKQARLDLDFLLQRLRTPLAVSDVLEIGCGVGRLAAVLAPSVASYTGFDIAPSMVAEARARHRDTPHVRFLEADGLGAPAAARDRRYHLALAHGVFIHCPREVIAELVTDAWALLADGGELRFQLRADPDDPTPLEHFAATGDAEPAPAAAPLGPGADDRTRRDAADQVSASLAAVPAEHAPLVQDHDYMGAVFRSDEVLPFLAGLPGAGTGEISAVRVDRLHVYAALRRCRHPSVPTST